MRSPSSLPYMMFRRALLISALRSLDSRTPAQNAQIHPIPQRPQASQRENMNQSPRTTHPLDQPPIRRQLTTCGGCQRRHAHECIKDYLPFLTQKVRSSDATAKPNDQGGLPARTGSTALVLGLRGNGYWAFPMGCTLGLAKEEHDTQPVASEPKDDEMNESS